MNGGSLRAEYSGHGTVFCQGLVFKGPGMEGDLARYLIGLGHDPQTLLILGLDRKAVKTGTLDHMASLVWVDEADEIGFMAWEPDPAASYSRHLTAWWSARQAAKASQAGNHGHGDYPG